MPSSPTAARRALAAVTTTAALGGGLLAVAGPASAAPGDPDLTGVVTNSAGAPLAGVDVEAYTTPADGSAPRNVSSTTTDASGRYTFDGLDAESLAGSTQPGVAGENEFKLFFYWGPTTAADYHSTGYLDRGLGGTKNVRTAGSVVVPAGGAATAPNQVLPTAGGVLLTVTGATGQPVNNYGSGDLYVADAVDPLDAYANSGSTGYDDEFYPDTDGDGDPNAPVDGQVYIPGVDPAQTYVVSAYGQDYNTTTGVSTNYVSRFFGGTGTYADAKQVKVAAGAFTPVSIQLSDKLTAVEEPRIVGNSSFGSKLKAEPGTWLRQQGTEFTYQWLRGDKVVGTGDKYKVTKKDKGKKIRLVVTAYNDPFVGTAMSDPTSKVGEKSKVTVVGKAANGAVKVKVVVAKNKLAKKLGTPKGKVVLVTEDGATASKKVKLKNGMATLKPRGKFAGEKLTVVYLGGGKLGSDTVALKGGKKK